MRSIAGFPEVAMIEQMYKKYGEMLSRQDLDGVHAASRGAAKSGVLEEAREVDSQEIVTPSTETLNSER